MKRWSWILGWEGTSGWPGYLLAVVATALSTGISTLLVGHLHQVNLVMIYLLGVTLVAARTSAGPAILASFLAVAVFDFTFVPPRGTFAVEDAEYLFTFAVMLLVSLLISTMMLELRRRTSAHVSAARQVQAEQMRSDLLSSVSHDLNTPLASIEGSCAAILSQPELSGTSRALAETIREESMRMERLIRNLLDMTRLQDVRLNYDWYDLDELVGNAVLKTEPLFVHPVAVRLEPELPLVRVDGLLVEQLLINLLENASRHAGRSATAEISAESTCDGIRITVTDDGPGFPPEATEHLFQRFERRGVGGFGLGLAICRAIARAHRGDINAVPSESGAKIVVELPVNPKEAHG